MAEERRRLERLNLLTDVSFTKKGSLEKEKLSLSKNISAGGICVISYEPLEESDILDLKISLPEDKEPISAVGKVVWIKEFTVGSEGKRFDVGVEFMEIKEEDKDKINKYVFGHI